MTLYNTQTEKSTEHVFDKAREIFGEGGLGLKITEKQSRRLSFEGDAGQILVTVSDDIDPTSVTVETLKFEYTVNEFLDAIDTSD